MTKTYDPVSYRVVFASSAPIWVSFLQAIAADPRFDIVGVVTQPDQPVGRGLKMTPNIIKTEAEKLLTNSKKYNFILLHGHTGRPNSGLLPRLQLQLEKQWHQVICPILPDPDDYSIDEKVDFLKKSCKFTENTIIVWHSFGSLVGMKLIEQLDQPIAGMVSVAGMYDRRVTDERRARNNHDAFIDYDNYRNWYGDISVNYQLLQQHCKSFIIVWDQQDPAVPPAHQITLSQQLNSSIIQWIPQWHHLTWDQEPLILQWVESLLKQINTPDFITTPNTLRLESKKYPWEWVQFQSWLESQKPDFLVIIAYGNIIPQHILDVPTIAPINVHGSLLPSYRGASPIQSVLLNDEAETGITIMRMDAGLDTGPMLRKQWFPLTIHTTALDIIHQFSEFGPQLLIDTMVDYATGKVAEVVQPEDGVSHCSKLEKTHGLVNPWTQSLHEINNIYRGCYLWPKTYFILDDSRGKHAGKQIIIDTLQLDETLWEANKDRPLFTSSLLLDKGAVRRTEGLGGGDLGGEINAAITTLLIKPEWSKAMKWEDWLRGI